MAWRYAYLSCSGLLDRNIISQTHERVSPLLEKTFSAQNQQGCIAKLIKPWLLCQHTKFIKHAKIDNVKRIKLQSKILEVTIMSIIEMDSKIKELRELRRMADELQSEIDALQDVIKAEMTARDVDMLSGADWKVTWKAITSNRLDSTALKKELPDVAARYMKQTTARRFVLA